MILALLLALSACASPLTEKWSAKVEDGEPVAAFFDVSSAHLFVSVKEEGDSARIDRFDLSGKLVKKGIARAHGLAGNLRAHSGKIYWVAGQTVWRFQPETARREKVGEIPGKLGEPRDLAVTRNGEVLVGLSDGVLYSLAEEGKIRARGASIGGMFLLDNILYILRETKLEPFDLSGKNQGVLSPVCRKKCSGLEKTSSGSWITAEEPGLREFSAKSPKSNRILLETNETLGRFAYVYERDTANDLLIVPFSSEKSLRAFRIQSP